MKKPLILISSFILAAFGFWQAGQAILAEQAASSPESGVDSRTRAVYESVESLAYGSEDAGSWGDWGAWWNRIRSAGEWVPEGDLLAKDVFLGKTFYAGSRTKQTGTLEMFLVEYDDYKNGTGADDSAQEEATWTNPATNVWQDQRTDLYWSNSRGQATNIFPNQDHSACPFFDLADRGDYDGLDADCGDAINGCGLLSLEAVTGAGVATDWYLPSQKELIQAYLDGMENQTTTAFVIDGSAMNYWAPTENAATPANAWYVLLATGYVDNTAKTNKRDFRCVRRD